MGNWLIRPAMRARAGVGLVIVAIALTACASLESLLGPLGTPFQSKPEPATPQASEIECPQATVRTGAATWQIPAGVSAPNVRYQATLGQIERECALLGQTVTAKVGIEARLLVGPKGGPGRVNVPVRIALVQEGPQPKSLWTKFYSVSVEVPASQSQVTFGQVEDDLTFPLPADRDISRYVIYVGFDPKGEPSRPPAKGKAKAPAKAAPAKAKAAKGPPPPPASTPGPQPGFAPPPNQFEPPPAQR
jgi:hypothetical protein